MNHGQARAFGGQRESVKIGSFYQVVRIKKDGRPERSHKLLADGRIFGDALPRCGLCVRETQRGVCGFLLRES
jgi:hypothetical protein